MKTKGILAVVLAALLSFGAGIGTLAYYQSTFSASGDFESEEWNVSASGIETGMEFEKTFTNLDLAPGRAEGYGFIIRRNQTEVNYVIKVTVETEGALFDDQGDLPSPVLVKLGTGSAAPTPVTSGAVIEVKNTGAYADAFTLNVVWPWETPDFVDPNGASYDNLWANKTGNVTVKAVVVQEQEFGTPATMRLYIKPQDAAYALVAPLLGVTSGNVDKTISGRMEVDATNQLLKFKANDVLLGTIEVNNRNINFVTLAHQTSLPSDYIFNGSDGSDVKLSKSGNAMQIWFNFIE